MNSLKWVLISVFVMLLVGALLPFDDTDNISTKERSGLMLYIDHGTGCQYIKGGLFGSITPRMDVTGKQVCR